jgi:di/tricarboxylate transporter
MNTVTIAAIVILSVLLWVSYYAVFHEQPEKEETIIIVGVAVLCVIAVRGVINRLHKKGNKS